MMSMKQAVIFYYMPVCDTFHCNLSIKKIVPLQKNVAPLSLSQTSHLMVCHFICLGRDCLAISNDLSSI